MEFTERHLNVFPLDVNGKPIPGAKVYVLIGTAEIGSATSRGIDGAPVRLQTPTSVTQVTLRAEYLQGSKLIASEPVTVDLDEGNITIYLDGVEMPGDVPKWFPI